MNYPRPITIQGLGQGDFLFTPVVKGFGPFDTMQELEDDINAYFLLQIAQPESTISMGQVDYQATQKANNLVVHSALMHYTLITVN